MIKDYVKMLLFLSSYAPLFLIIAVKNYFELVLVAAMAALMFLPVLVLRYVMWQSSKMSGEYREVKTVEDKSNQFLEYIIAYIIPFLGFNLTSIPDALSLAIVFALIGILYVRSELIYMNPLLNLMKYNLYKVDGKRTNFMIISKKEILVGDKVRVYFITNKVGVAK